ncbi:sugar transferase [Nibricoccus sp. IMCC34717]|uniref:sugar transferase n=1 Tax=Nibricoccus sp. IMCC34717 TaxID=3034021 RepID=UPI00384B3B3B
MSASSPFGKRLLDLAFVLLSLPLFLATAALIWVLTRLKSPGPIFFIQERIGYQGQPFRCFKFRTMHVGISIQPHVDLIKSHFASGQPMAKLENTADPRMIPCGTIIRASGLDELPQIINILRGEMSLIGPRPWTAYEHELLTEYQKHRMDAVPGLTGLWQVSGKNHTTVPEMLELDLHYARHRSFWLDLFILFKTPPTLLAQMLESRKIAWCRRLAKVVHRTFGLTVKKKDGTAVPF